eukprot:1535480-Rhodomonas_salina.1
MDRDGGVSVEGLKSVCVLGLRWGAEREWVCVGEGLRGRTARGCVSVWVRGQREEVWVSELPISMV